MLVGGVTGFGSSLVTTPFLLLLGVPLPMVITANLTLVLATRIGVAARFGGDHTASADPARSR